jgi:hypothetical protein
MTLYDQIIAKYPDLVGTDIFYTQIILQDDSDGVGAYIKKWDYNKPLPVDLKVGKPSA